jgi:cysteinyl-tRNA synthetase
MDFVLWKPSKAGEPAWPSPCGIAAAGRPGWNIECSAMADRWLWEEAKAKLSAAGLAQPHVFDIHGGGIDLVFPHHENELAQSRCGHGTAVMANYWMHNGFLQVEGEKMSKSLGNFVTIRELLDGWKGQKWERPELRLLMLSTHYRQPMDWTLQGLEEARGIVSNWKRTTASVEHDQIEIVPSTQVAAALSDDLNTPEAIAALHEAAKAAADEPRRPAELYADLVFLGILADRKLEAQRIVDAVLPTLPENVDSADLVVAMRRQKIDEQLKLCVQSVEPSANVISVISSVATSVDYGAKNPDFMYSWTVRGPKFISSTDIKLIEGSIGVDELNSKLQERLDARKAKNFKKADAIRDELTAIGIQLKDAKDPATGEIVTTWEVRASGATEVKR